MATSNSILKKAISFIGTKEAPPNSNNVIFNTQFYGKKVSGSAYPWCCVFIWYIFKACNAGDLFCNGAKVAYCPNVETWAKDKKIWHDNKSGKAGDLCLMDFGKGRASHIGIVEKKNADGSYTVIEGNTSLSSNDNGGCVMRRTRYTKNIRGFARPKYSNTAASANTTEKSAETKSTATKYTHKQFVMDVQSAIDTKADGNAKNIKLSKHYPYFYCHNMYICRH